MFNAYLFAEQIGWRSWLRWFNRYLQGK